MAFDLKGKVAIVTGSSSGIGLATTKLFLSSGAKVFGVDIVPVTDEETTKAGSTGEFAFLQIDITAQSATQEIVQACDTKYGRQIDILVNVAGIMDKMLPPDRISDNLLQRVMDVNLTAPIKLMGQVLPIMKEQKSGAIINISSIAGRSGACSGVAYAASKHGLVGATKNVAWCFKGEGIRCNAVAPGAVATSMATSTENWDVENYRTIRPYVSLLKPDEGVLKPMDPVEVARLIAFLASDLSTKINGAVVPIDDGQAATMP